LYKVYAATSRADPLAREIDVRAEQQTRGVGEAALPGMVGQFAAVRYRWRDSLEDVWHISRLADPRTLRGLASNHSIEGMVC
jgi:hypothetical protein